MAYILHQSVVVTCNQVENKLTNGNMDTKNVKVKVYRPHKDNLERLKTKS